MAEIITDDITTGVLPGLGVFDELMTANQVRLDKQYSENRLRGPDYAKVYLGSMEAIMQQSIVFLLGRQKADKEAELIVEQTLKVIAEVILIGKQGEKLDAETDLLIDQLITEALNRDKTSAEIDLLVDQLLTQALERDKISAEIEGIEAVTALTNQKLLTEVETTALTAAKVVTEGKQQELIDGQIEKMSHEIHLIEAQVWSERGKVSDDCSIIDPPPIIGGLIGGQLTKITNEGLLLVQKVETEKAQTSDTVTAGTVAGVIGKQKDLYAAQTDGFARDAEQKLTKIMVDSWNVRRTTNDETHANPAGIGDAEICKVIGKAKEGIAIADPQCTDAPVPGKNTVIITAHT